LALSSGPVLNKAELAHALNVSLPTLSRWLMRYAEFPVLERGTNGRDYKFDAAAVFEFLRARQEEQAQAAADKDEQLSQLKLPFEVPGADQAPAKTSVKDEIEAYKLRKLQREEAERAGQLVPVAQVSDALQTVFARLSRDMHAFIRQIGREQQWPDSYIRSVEARLAQAQRVSVRDLDELLGTPAVQDDERRVA
jgi:phage terminase Nu1 subunit (DNA packaging protein)